MSIHISQLTSEKEFLHSELDHSQNQINQLVTKNHAKDDTIKQQQDELQTVKSDMNRTKTVFNKMHSQINLLKGKVEHPFSESEKVVEMEAVIDVCKQQIHNFDQINVMSQQVIERLERQLAEYKYELEQAKDTIEVQH